MHDRAHFPGLVQACHDKWRGQ